MEIEVQVPIRFRLSHPEPLDGAIPNYETGSEAADQVLTDKLEERAAWLAMAGTPAELRRRIQELQEEVAGRCGEPCARDAEVTRAILAAMKDYVVQRGWTFDL